MHAATEHDSVDPDRERRRALPGFGLGRRQGFSRSGGRLRRPPEIGIVAEPVELKPLLRA